MKSPAMLPLRKDPIQNQDSTVIITQQDTIFPQLLEKWPTGYKTFMHDTHFSNKTEDQHNDPKDNPRTDNKISETKLDFKNYEDKYDEYKEDHSYSPKSDESVIKIESE